MDQTARRRTYAVAALLVLGSLLYLALPYLAWRWTEIPFPGFFVDPNLVVNDGGSRAWPAKQLSPPVAYPQRLVAIDGEEVSTLAEMTALLTERGAGTDVALSFAWPHDSIVAPGSVFRSRTVTVSLLDLSFTESAIYFWPFYLVGLAILSIGLWVFRRRPDTGISQTFALFTLMVAWGVGGYFDASTTHVFLRLWVVALPYAALCQLLLVATFPQVSRFASRWPWARWVALALATVMAGWAEWWLYSRSDPWAYVVPWRVSFTLSLVAIGLALALSAYPAFSSDSPPVRQQARLLLIAIFAACLPLAAWFLTYAFDVRLALLPVAVYPLALGWVALSDKQNRQQFDEAELPAHTDQSLLARERVNAVSDLESRVSELEMLSQFSQALNYTIEYDVLLELVYTYCQRLLGVKDFYIALRDPDRQTPYSAFHVENDRRLPERERGEHLVKQPLVLQVMTTGQQLLTVDETGFCWLLAPLNAGAETLGVLYTRSSRPEERFGERQQQLFSVFADRTATALDRWQVSRELQTRARQLQTINEVTHLLTATIHLDELLELILEKAMELLDAEAGSFLMVDEDTGELEFRVVSGPAGEELLGTRLSPGTGLAGTAAQSGRPVLVNDVHHDQRWFEGIDASTDFETESSLSVPLLRQRQVIGVLQIVNKRSGAPYDEDDETLLAAFAGQAVVAVETARLLRQTDEALQARVRELSLLQQLDRDLSTTLELEPVVGVTLNWALRLCEGTAGSLVLLGEEGTPVLRAHRGYDPSFDPGILSGDALSGGLVGQVLRTGRPHLTGNVQAEPNYIPAAFETRSQMTVPLTFQQRTMGAIAIERDARDAFGPEDVERAVRLANHAGAAIANALLYEQVIAANNAKSEFVSMVSHELKTPLTAIRGYADLMLSGMTGKLTGQQRGFLETIGKNITKTSRLIEDLTDISRLETGKLHIDPVPTSFATVVSEAVQTVQGAYAEKAIELHLALPADLPPVMGDPDRLVQIMTNLLSNAGKYSPPEADVIVTVRDQIPEHVSPPSGRAGEAETPLVYCAVQDTGFGMSEDDQKQLFTKFFRSGDPNVRQAPGTGLGLSITRGIVEMHGGQIWFDSVLSEGTTFHFTVPQAR